MHKAEALRSIRDELVEYVQKRVRVEYDDRNQMPVRFILEGKPHEVADILAQCKAEYQRRILSFLIRIADVRTCDPWAAQSARSFAKHTDEGEALMPIRSKILRFLKETGGIEPPVLLVILGGEMTPKQLECEFAILRHMEKVRGEKRGD